MARLMIFDERMRGIDLPGHAIIIGRSKRVDLPITDRILSRKHCSIVPMDSGFSIVDLKSQNGTFVNGERIDKADLEYDDVIEIGETVMVILDTDSWNRGEGLTRLRNPVKAQELIQKIKGSSVPVSGMDSRVPEEVAEADTGREQVLQKQLLVDLVLKELAGALLEEEPRHRAAVQSAAQQMLSEGWGEKSREAACARAGELLAAGAEDKSSPDAGEETIGAESSEGE